MSFWCRLDNRYLGPRSRPRDAGSRHTGLLGLHLRSLRVQECVGVQDGAKKRPKLELDSPADAVVRRIFLMALQGKSTLDITKTLNGEGIPTSTGKHWLKSTVHRILSNEAYTGTLIRRTQ